MSGIYSVDGAINIIIVDGSTFTGVYASDGSRNVYEVDGSSFVGAYANCGALNVVVTTSAVSSIYHPCGALYVSETPFYTGARPVTVVSGSWAGGGGGGTAGSPMGLLLTLTYAA